MCRRRCSVRELDLTVLSTAWPGGPGRDVSGTGSGGDIWVISEPATLFVPAVHVLSLSKRLALSLPKGVATTFS